MADSLFQDYWNIKNAPPPAQVQNRFGEMDRILTPMWEMLKGKTPQQQMEVAKNFFTPEAYKKIATPLLNRIKTGETNPGWLAKNPANITPEYLYQALGWENNPEAIGVSPDFDSRMTNTFTKDVLDRAKATAGQPLTLNFSGTLDDGEKGNVGTIQTSGDTPVITTKPAPVITESVADTTNAGVAPTTALDDVAQQTVKNDIFPYSRDALPKYAQGFQANSNMPWGAAPETAPVKGLLPDYSNYGGPQIVQETLNGTYDDYINNLHATAWDTPESGFMSSFKNGMGMVGDGISKGFQWLGENKAGIDTGLGLLSAANNIYSGYKTRQMADKQFDLMKKNYANSVTAYNNQAEGLNATRKSMGSDLRAKLLT
jgi:hypothetical protein